MLKKTLAVLFAIMMVVVMFAGCAKAPVDTPVDDQPVEGGEAVEGGDDVPAGDWAPYGEKLYLGVAVRSLSNPYHVRVIEGAEKLAEDLNAVGFDIEVVPMLCEGSDEQQVSDIQALIARGGDNVVLYVDPNNAPNAGVIADICEEAGVYWCSVWNVSEGVYPMQYTTWVAHSSPDDVVAGYEIAVDMFEKFETPGEGKILALEGMLGNTASQNRTKGLQKALEEYPGVEVLDMQPTDWDMTISLNITETWLSKYSDFDGIWTSGDPMGLGALTALETKGLDNGKVKVTGVNGTQEAIDSILAGDLTNTWDARGFEQGYYMSAWAIAAKIGMIDVESAPVSDRMFLTPGQLINAENAGEAGTDPVVDFNNFRDFNIGAMENDWEG